MTTAGSNGRAAPRIRRPEAGTNSRSARGELRTPVQAAVKLCECGCGQPAPIAPVTNLRKGHIKGQPTRFVAGHNHRGKAKSPETRARMAAYQTARTAHHQANLAVANRNRPATSERSGEIHAWINRRFEKTGLCEDCGKAGKTDWSFQKHPNPYTRNRLDYRELCRSCHTKYDIAIGYRKPWNQLGKAEA